MKKTLLVAVLAVALVFAFGSSAFAKNNVMMFDGTKAVGTTITNAAGSAEVPPVYNHWTEATALRQSYGQPAEAPVLGLENITANAGDSSPHGGYTTATVKCAACHAVHAASTLSYSYEDKDGVTVTKTPDTLLKMAANDSCAFCHVTNPINSKVVYGGSLAIVSGGGDDHHSPGSNCSTCHASVHGANAIKDVPAVEGLLLKSLTGSYKNLDTMIATTADGSGFTAAEYADGTIAAGERSAAVGLFCAGCHSGSYQNATANSTNGTGTMTGHRVMAEARSTYNGSDIGSTAATLTVAAAFAPATDCKSCHDADNGFGDAGFPHFTPGAARFLNSGSYAGSADTTAVGVSATADDGTFGVIAGGVDANATMENVAQYSLQDGVCLKCHRDATTGVGITF
ncbi:MAG: hypothetical protein ACYCXR_01620 [Coriobacteriia bacterium]